MPEACRFYGIVIRMYFDDHNPPHLHAEYAGREVRVGITSLTVLSGQVFPRALGLVMEPGKRVRAEALEVLGIRD